MTDTASLDATNARFDSACLGDGIVHKFVTKYGSMFDRPGGAIPFSGDELTRVKARQLEQKRLAKLHRSSTYGKVTS